MADAPKGPPLRKVSGADRGNTRARGPWLDERLAVVEEMLFRRLLDHHTIERSLSREWKVTHRTIRRYLATVYKAHREQAGEDNSPIDRDKIRTALVDLYNRCLDTKDFKSAISALDRLSRLHGLYVHKVELAGPNGAPITMRVEDAREELLRRIDRLATSRGTAPPVDESPDGGGEDPPL